ncbi:putative F-box protein [Raphanus sativus]|uniref:F-box protein At4g10190 n=1 Tax=Raphanus sativus TaxID=3726 RepID=A0A6J0P167_RAPSA|nr:putative F-box protein At4g10190 [Raphanus sativus]KAJ4894069.1 putative F-box protein [Raphanus sativus]
MSVVSFHGVPSLVDESDDGEAMEPNAFRIGSEEYLPEDLVVDILSRVPLASLARFRSVSKRWKALINYVRFEKSSQIMLIDSRVYLGNINFLGAQEKIVNITSQFSLKDPLSNSSKEVNNIREVFHCEGLLLCTTEDNRLVVWNPCLDETTWIKPRSYYERSDIFAFGKSSCNKYKILRITLHGPRPAFEFMKPRLYEIYDFTSKSWRVIVHDETRDWSILGLGRRGTCVDGNAYWLAFSSSQHQWMDILLRFDFSTERFTSMDIPSSGRTFALSVTREEQKLCLLACVAAAADVDVWMANKIDSSGAMSWSKFLTVKRVYNNNQWMFLTGMNFLVDEENKVIVCPGKSLDSDRFLHIVGEDKCIQVDQHDVGGGSRCSLLLSYAPTLVSISDIL